MNAMTQEQFLARALYEIRLLLSSHVGGYSNASPDVREAAELAYALHNFALASMRGESFSLSEASESLGRLDSRLGYVLVERFKDMQ